MGKAELSLRQEIVALGLSLQDGINESYEYKCTCGQGDRGEIECEHCNVAVDAWNKFTKELYAILDECEKENKQRKTLSLARIQKCVDEQAEDDGLWFQAETASEAYLQQELRKLHWAIEAETGSGEEFGDQP